MKTVIVSALLALGSHKAFAACPAGWVPFEGSCYRFPDADPARFGDDVYKGMTWDAAAEYCESLGAFLPSMATASELRFLNSKSQGTQWTFWLGIREGADVTHDGTSSSVAPFVPAARGPSQCSEDGQPKCGRVLPGIFSYWMYIDCANTSCFELNYPVCVQKQEAKCFSEGLVGKTMASCVPGDNCRNISNGWAAREACVKAGAMCAGVVFDRRTRQYQIRRASAVEDSDSSNTTLYVKTHCEAAPACAARSTGSWKWDGVTQDKDESCWFMPASSYGCDKPYMQLNCAATCGKCPAKPVPCEKQDPNWQYDGETPDFNRGCAGLPSTSHGCDQPWVQTNCAKTCGTCVQQPYDGEENSDCYIGCFVDDPSRDLEKFLGRGYDVPKCRTECEAQNYKYFGLQENDQCFCGNAFATEPQYKRVPEEQCDRGSTGQRQGAAWRNSIYLTKCAFAN